MTYARRSPRRPCWAGLLAVALWCGPVAGGAWGQLLVVNNLAPQQQVILASPTGDSSLTLGADGSGVGQSFFLPDAGPFAYYWQITAITIRKADTQTVVNYPLTAWIFQWNPSTDPADASQWLQGAGAGQAFDGTGIDQFPVQARSVRITGTVADGKYLHLNFSDRPLKMKDLTAYGLYLEGGPANFRLQAGRSDPYGPGLALLTENNSNDIKPNLDLAFWVQGTPVTGPEQPGDFNEDGQVDQDDLTLVLENWGQLAQSPGWSAPYDGLVDQNELSDLLTWWGAGIEPPPPAFNPADFNHDGQVDQDDLTLVLGHWGQTSPPVGWQADFDGLMDQSELTGLLEHWGDGLLAGPGQVDASAVPAPPGLLLPALALAAGLARRPRRFRTALPARTSSPPPPLPPRLHGSRYRT